MNRARSIAIFATVGPHRMLHVGDTAIGYDGGVWIIHRRRHRMEVLPLTPRRAVAMSGLAPGPSPLGAGHVIHFEGVTLTYDRERFILSVPGRFVLVCRPLAGRPAASIAGRVNSNYHAAIRTAASGAA